MSDTPERCPTCGTSVPEGAPRCPGCGRVFGEANRCPHCHAVAAVIPRGGITVCAACGKPRAGAVVLGGGRGSIVPASRAGRAESTSAMLRRGKGRAQRGSACCCSRRASSPRCSRPRRSRARPAWPSRS
ncbi:MAG: hypothetical protein M5U28_32530 [Sandaracinaceae bacterium]|nr:hypothetical protein [Sandaracinaceae bacterium]